MWAPIVVGLEADFLYNSLDDKTLGVAGSAGVALGMNVEGDVKWPASARVRAGYAIDRILPFVTAGVAAAEYELTMFPMDTPQFRASRGDTYVGWTVGGGVEYAFTSNWLGRVAPA
jgi:outer membrane immunogenic protein